MLTASLPLTMLGGGTVYCDNSILYVKSDNEDFVVMALHYFIDFLPCLDLEQDSERNLVLEMKAGFYKIIFCNGQNRERKKKEGWFICQELLHFTSERKISVSRDTDGFISRWELGGRSRCLSHWQALWKPASTSEHSSAGVPVVHRSLPAVKVKWFTSESPGLRSGQNSIGLQTNCSSLSQKQEITISWLVGSAHSDRQCCSSPAAMCRSSLGAVALFAGLMNASLPPSPDRRNDGFLEKKYI